MKRLIFIVFFVLTKVACSFAAADNSSPNVSLKKFLQAWDNEDTTHYTATFQDLNDDGISEAIVYLTGGKWCGSGGCTMLILSKDEISWKVITKVTVTRLPIRVLEKKSHEWHSIGVSVKGGRVQKGYEAELPFNGKSYPTNPTVPPALRITNNSAGEIVIPTGKTGDPLKKNSP